MTTPKTKLVSLALIAALCAGFTLGLTAPAWAGLDEGTAALQRGDYATALREWRPLAKQGYAIAQNDLGVMFSKSVDDLILDGQQDDATVVKQYRKAAEQGHADALNNLGVMYGEGQGVTQNYVEAVKWYRKAAEQGHALAQYNLGLMYDNGQGVPQDYAKAHMWYNLAASKLRPGGGRDTAVENRDNVAKRMTPAQISEAQKLAREWKPKK